jgi:hypothetical protein
MVRKIELTSSAKDGPGLRRDESSHRVGQSL